MLGKKIKNEGAGKKMKKGKGKREIAYNIILFDL